MPMKNPPHPGGIVADQIEGLPAYFRPVASLELVEPAGREDELDRFFAAIPANLRNAGSEAYYEPHRPDHDATSKPVYRLRPLLCDARTRGM